MASDEERREAAARLRDFDQLRELFRESSICAFLSALDAGYVDWEHVCDRLADLIEPEPELTCRNVIDSKDKFVCDVCGAFVRDTHIGCSCIGPDVVKMYSTSNDHSFSYCPNCGAMVVE